ncbi:MAG TPA: IspD/TarI family cytidylyltransferase [Candidatus Nanopelagicaceae bacterium]|jgi:2-C-methyl-D-erythritol 4-phosphate cytidylyltransferase
MMRVAVVILAAGSGTRFGHSTNKVWLPLDDRRIISHSLENAVKSFGEYRAVLVVDPSDADMAKDVLSRETPDISVELVSGGRTRHESEFNALKYLSSDISAGNIDVVLIHDGARPLASSNLFEEIANAAQIHGGALPAIDVDPLEIDIVTEKRIARVQTPQGFRAKEVLAAYMQADKDGFVGTDTAACMEQYFPNTESVAVPGEVTNIKITYPHDLVLAQKVIAAQDKA